MALHRYYNEQCLGIKRRYQMLYSSHFNTRVSQRTGARAVLKQDPKIATPTWHPKATKYHLILATSTTAVTVTRQKFMGRYHLQSTASRTLWNYGVIILGKVLRYGCYDDVKSRATWFIHLFEPQPFQRITYVYSFQYPNLKCSSIFLLPVSASAHPKQTLSWLTSDAISPTRTAATSVRTHHLIPPFYLPSPPSHLTRPNPRSLIPPPPPSS